MFTHGSLFNGIGGFQVATQYMGWENVFSCEIDNFCNQVTKYHFPECKQYEDIKTTNFSKYRGKIDLLTGGFPCQPFSLAGKRLGTEDDRNLWSEMYRAIQEVQPRWVVAENVSGIISWSKGLVFEQVQTDLENQGYQVQAFMLPSCGVNAPHKREHVWIVAYRSDTRIENLQQKRKDRVPRFKTAPNPNEIRWTQNDKEKQTREPQQNFSNWRNFPTQPPICGGDDGLPKELDSITFPRWRRESIKAYGNAIVPQVAIQIFKAIEEYEAIG